MAQIATDTLPLRSELDIVSARQFIRKLTREAGFSLVEQTKMVTAASELARNALIHGQGGELRWEILAEDSRTGLRLTFTDHGPGIADLQRAMTDGFSSGSGLGMGLGGAKRLVNEFSVESKAGEGTRVAITRWK